MQSELTIIEQVVSVQIIEPDTVRVDIVEEPISVEIGEVHNIYYNSSSRREFQFENLTDETFSTGLGTTPVTSVIDQSGREISVSIIHGSSTVRLMSNQAITGKLICNA